MWLAHVFQLPGDVMRAALDELFGLAAAGRLRVIGGGEYGLSEVRKAHEDLRARRTTGKLVLDPSR
jgi:NADPH2:quinone reductase